MSATSLPSVPKALLPGHVHRPTLDALPRPRLNPSTYAFKGRLRRTPLPLPPSSPSTSAAIPLPLPSPIPLSHLSDLLFRCPLPGFPPLPCCLSPLDHCHLLPIPSLEREISVAFLLPPTEYLPTILKISPPATSLSVPSPILQPFWLDVTCHFIGVSPTIIPLGPFGFHKFSP